MDWSLILPWTLCALAAIYIAYQRRALASAAAVVPKQEEEIEIPDIDSMQVMITTHVLEALIKMIPPAASQEEFKQFAVDGAQKFTEVRGELIARMEEADAIAEHGIPLDNRAPTFTQDDVLINPPDMMSHAMALEHAVDRASLFLFRHGYPAIKKGQNEQDYIRDAARAQGVVREVATQCFTLKYPAPAVTA